MDHFVRVTEVVTIFCVVIFVNRFKPSAFDLELTKQGNFSSTLDTVHLL
jgi:hypothetical protein